MPPPHNKSPFNDDVLVAFDNKDDDILIANQCREQA